MPNPHQLAALAIKVLPVPLVQKDQMEKTVTMELLVNQEKTERMPNCCPLRKPNHASSAQLDHPDPTDQWDLKAHPDQKEPPESHHAMAFPATSAWLDNPDQWEDQAAKDPVEHLEPQDASSPSPVPKAPTDLPDHPENKESKANPVPMDNHLLARPENPESQANQEKKADLDHPEPRDQSDTMARKEAATIVQSPALHQAIKRESSTKRSGFRKFGNGTVSITLLFCFIFTTGRKQKNLF
jgi:hypothetical protein